jgi:NAD-dependent dihydropyrimidine dehydrogenase PreA subunit
MSFDKFSGLFLSSCHIFSEHIGWNPKDVKFKKVGPVQYAVHWLYGVSEPTILKLVDWILSKKAITDTKIGNLFLKFIALSSWYFPHGIIVTTKAAGNWVDFIVQSQGPKGARLAVGPCVCQKALNRWQEPIKKDMTVLYGADIYYHLNLGYELVSSEQAKSILKECHEAGLVHALEFCLQSGKWHFVICNCDHEICAPTRVYLHTGKFNYAGPEIVRHDATKCIGKDKCGKCIDRCIYGVNRAVGESIALDIEKCLGCGLCITTCKGDARHMVIRADYSHDHQVPSNILLGSS